MAGKHRQKEQKPADVPEQGASQRERQLEQLLLELEVHHEELCSQQVQLIDSQRALEEARDRYAELFDFAPIAFVVIDSAGTIQQANLCSARLLGMDRHLLIGSPLFVHVVPQDRRSVLNHMTCCRRGDLRVDTEVMLQPKGGVPRSVELLSAPARPSSEGGRNVFLT